MAYNRFYNPTKYSSRTDVLRYGIKCVFIAHQKNDKEYAKKVAEYLINAGVDVYFDEYDSELKIHHQNNDPNKVTQAICAGINNSSHMLVLVSPSTINSSWVPFEIGYGFDKTDLAVLCLKGIPRGTLPEYIRTTKVIRDIYDLNGLISQLVGQTSEYLIERKAINKYDSKDNSLNTVMDPLIY